MQVGALGSSAHVLDRGGRGMAGRAGLQVTRAGGVCPTPGPLFWASTLELLSAAGAGHLGVLCPMLTLRLPSASAADPTWPSQCSDSSGGLWTLTGPNLPLRHFSLPAHHPTARHEGAPSVTQPVPPTHVSS